ncbi:hypothetical protein D9M69_464950 [compost metagenome]
MHQFLHLEALHVGAAQPILIGIQQCAMGTTQHVGLQRLAQGVVLQQYGQTGQCALRLRRTGQAVQCRPQRSLLLGADGHAFLQQARFQPLGGPGSVSRLIDACEGLEGQVAIASEVVVLATESQHRCT